MSEVFEKTNAEIQADVIPEKKKRKRQTQREDPSDTIIVQREIEIDRQRQTTDNR